MKIENIYPSSLQIKYDYIKVNNTYISSIVICELASKIDILEINKIIPAKLQSRISIYVEKLDLHKEVKNLSKIIAETGAEIKSISPNQQDIDIINKMHREAIELRKKIQINSEELYHINIYILLSDIFIDKLKMKVNSTISWLYASGILSRVANFRHEEAYLNSLPIYHKNVLDNKSGINVTTSELAYLIPYVTDSIFDKNGIMYGFVGNSVCIYDIFSKTNMNYNMCILGSSRSR